MAVSLFMKIGDVEGESTKKGYEGWSELLAINMGGSQSGTMQIGTGGTAGKVTIQDISGQKYVDKASSVMFQQMCSGQHFPTAEIHVTKAGGTSDVMIPYVKYKLTDVIISSLNQSPSDGTELVMESFTLNFSKIEYDYTPQNADGTPGTEIPKTFNIKTNSLE